jgi:hypothetical protein
MRNEKINIQPEPIIQYIIVFTTIHVFISALVQSLRHFFNIDFGFGSYAVIVVGAGLVAIIKFISDHGRIPIKSERVRLVWLSYFFSLIASILETSMLWFIIGGASTLGDIGQVLSSFPVLSWIIFLMLVTLIYYLVLRFVYDWGAKYCLNKIKM